MRIKRVVGTSAAILVLTVVSLLTVSAAGAQTYPGDGVLTVSTPTVVQGGVLSATVTGCVPGETISFVLTPGPFNMGTVVADSTGKGTVTVTVPANTAPGAYTVTATCGTQVLTASVQVLGVSVTPAPAPAPAATALPRTGSDSDGLVRAGVAFVAVGGVLVAATMAISRRRSVTAR